MRYTPEDIQRECYDLALHTYATHYVYSVKYKLKGRLLKAITLLGFISPVLLGGIVSSYGLTAKVSEIALLALTPIALLQLILSSCSLIYKWEEQSSYFLESSIGNRMLSEEFHTLAKYPTNDLVSNIHSFEILLERNRNREEQDDKYPFDDAETRKGMRYSLRRYQRKCVGCNSIPTSMISTPCNVCGSF
ncbi:MAG: hypothetical protein EOO43_00735 [Flavobacterium sp.]|nr:MAG: hypothetical protein EOO43_00735 [Flavobacterium sp.]